MSDRCLAPWREGGLRQCGDDERDERAAANQAIDRPGKDGWRHGDLLHRTSKDLPRSNLLKPPGCGSRCWRRGVRRWRSRSRTHEWQRGGTARLASGRGRPHASHSPATSPRRISREVGRHQGRDPRQERREPAVAGPHRIQRGEGREREFTGQAKSRARGHIHSPVLVLVQFPSMGTPRTLGAGAIARRSQNPRSGRARSGSPHSTRSASPFSRRAARISYIPTER
jgi:hypothetical protein